jgi:hypothetical protein
MGSTTAPLTSSAKGRTIQITLPAQGYLNPLESYLRFDLVLAANGATVTTIAPRILNSVHTMFRRLRLMYGSMVLEDIQLYNALVRTLTNVAVEAEYQTGVGAVLEGMGSDSTRGQLFNGTFRSTGSSSNGSNTIGALASSTYATTTSSSSAVIPDIAPTVGRTTNFVVPPPGRSLVTGLTTITNDGNYKHTFCIQLASGLLTQQKLIPLKWLANQLTIELELEEPSMFLVTGFTGHVPATSTVSGVAASGGTLQSGGDSVLAPALTEEIIPNGYTAGTNVGAVTGPGFDLDAPGNVSKLAYYLDNIYYVAEILEFDSTYDAAFYQGMASGGVPIKFSSWHTHQHMLGGNSTILTIQERARSVKSAFSIIRSRADQTSDTLLSDPYWCYPGTATAYTSAGAAMYWSEKGAGIDEFQWRIGGRYFPSQPIKCSNGGAEPLIELQKALNLLGDYSLAPPISDKTWMKPRGLFVLASEFEATNGFEMSGINAEELADLALIIKLQGGGDVSTSGGITTSASYLAADFSNTSDIGKMFATTFVNYDCLLIIRPNNVMELVQ